MLKVANSIINASQIKTPITFAGDVTLSTGNLVIGTSGKGIDFSVTSSGSGTMTSELLADYEEGTWTPNQGAGLTVVGAFSSGGSYTKIGRQVTIQGYVLGATSVAMTANTVMFTNLPFTVLNDNYVGGTAPSSRVAGGQFLMEGATSRATSITTLSPVSYIEFSGTYFV